MAKVISANFRIHNAEQFVEALSETTATNLYMFIGGPVVWPDESTPPTPSDSVANTAYAHWRDMISAKKLDGSDVSQIVKRYNWTTNTAYTAYTDTNADLYSNTFYVVTTSDHVYKCVQNNINSGNSTSQPTGTSTKIIETDDGYKWKYLYTISPEDKLKFVTTDYVPVQKVGSVDDGSNQFNVEDIAIDGAVDIINKTANGTSFLFDEGTLASVQNTSVITLAASANTTDGIYVNSTVYITNNASRGEQSVISAYDGAQRRATLVNAFSVLANTSSGYQLAPTANVNGDGSAAKARCIGNSGTQVTKIEITKVGSSYTTANVTVYGNASHGSGATGTVIIGPPGGHGSNAPVELGGHYVIVNARLSGNEDSKFATSCDYRKVGLLRDPKQYSNVEAFFTGAQADQTFTLTLTGVTGTFGYPPSTANDEVIYQGGTLGSSTANGTFVDFRDGNKIRITDVLGTFVANSTVNTITGNTSGGTATVSTIATPDMKRYSGEILYIENRAAITRSEDQLEDIKLVLEF